jgi:hypothetical protein
VEKNSKEYNNPLQPLHYFSGQDLEIFVIKEEHVPSRKLGDPSSKLETSSFLGDSVKKI